MQLYTRKPAHVPNPVTPVCKALDYAHAAITTQLEGRRGPRGAVVDMAQVTVCSTDFSRSHCVLSTAQRDVCKAVPELDYLLVSDGCDKTEIKHGVERGSLVSQSYDPACCILTHLGRPSWVCLHDSRFKEQRLLSVILPSLLTSGLDALASG